jgi:hypothetical protein
MGRAAGAVAALVLMVGALPAAAAGPAALSADTSRADIASTYGSGVFGQWTVDGLGLPDYRYTIDEQTSPAAAQPELSGSTDAWHQLGNDHVVADAFNHGYVQLWSQDRLYQWMNYYDAAHQHYTGGYGYLNVGGKAYSTLYDDRDPSATAQRDFGVGYYAKDMRVAGLDVSERVYAPFGDDPLLLHDVTLRNTSASPKQASWFEYWDVNPAGPPDNQARATGAPVYDAATQTLSVAQLPSGTDTDPLSIFAAALTGPVSGFDTDTGSFFGSGTRAAPAAVVADHTSDSIAAPGLGHAMFAFRSPVTLAPGQSVTLRYAYGYGHPAQIAPLVARYRAASDPYTASQQQWAKFVPQADFGPGYTWLARELQWDAYTVRSDSTYEECAGRHILSQGGYYQYGFGFQGAFRDPLQHMLPMIYADPPLARDVLLYSAQEQPQGGGQIPYAIIPMCQPFHLGTSDDLDLWLMWSAAEYGLASRDVGFFDQPVKWSDAGSASLWDHLKAAFAHQESIRGPHGGYLTGATGDWSDFSTQFLQMSESMLVAAQAAYIYPRLAELADLRGDHAFAAQLRATASGLVGVLRAQWTGQGWYSRGYAGSDQLGHGVIYGEPQPWAMLAGAPTAAQATTLVANIRRYLTGIGAPGGPSPIGSSQSPAANDPGVTENSQPSGGVGDNHAVYVGGDWFAVNGWLTWALGDLDGIVPHASDYAFDELVRNTLATHAAVYPSHWDGVISVDDACRSWYSTGPEQCGVGLSSSYDGQIMHQPAWSLFDVIKLAGIEPVADGYRITPRLPMSSFSLRLPQVGVAAAPGVLRGYIRPEQGGRLRMHVAVPAGSDPATVIAYAGGQAVPHSLAGGLVEFDLPTVAGQAADWAVSAAASPGVSLGVRTPTACASRRHFVIRLVAPRGQRLRRATVYVNGRRVRVISGRRLRAPVDLRGLPRGTFRVRIAAVTTRGRHVTATRRYHTCVKRRVPARRRAAPKKRHRRAAKR